MIVIRANTPDPALEQTILSFYTHLPSGAIQ